MIIEYLFISLLVFQTLHMLLQDWVDLFPFNDIQQMSQEMPLKTRILVILGNVTPSVIALVMAVIYLGQSKPVGVGLYFVVYFGLLLVLMYFAWYQPYLLGATPAQIDQYRLEYGRTHQILPAIGDHPRPNTLHVMLHVVFILNTVLAVLIGFNGLY